MVPSSFATHKPVFAGTVLTNGIDRTIDRAFSVGGALMSGAAALFGKRMQDGDVGKYAWMVAAGALAMLAALTLS